MTIVQLPGERAAAFSGEVPAALRRFPCMIADTLPDGEGDLRCDTASSRLWREPIPEPEPEPDKPTTDERVAELEAENKRLSAKVAALTDQNDFQEELIVELANIVYA